MLLVAVDPGGCAWKVVEEAVGLASDLKSDVTLMTAVTLPEGVSADVELHGGRFEGKTAEAVLVEEARTALADLAVPFHKQGVHVALEVRVGPCVDAVLDAAAELKPRMVMVGTHGRKGLKRFFLGSVAEQIIRRAEVPVLAVRSSGHTDRISSAKTAVEALADG